MHTLKIIQHSRYSRHHFEMQWAQCYYFLMTHHNKTHCLLDTNQCLLFVIVVRMSKNNVKLNTLSKMLILGYDGGDICFSSICGTNLSDKTHAL